MQGQENQKLAQVQNQGKQEERVFEMAKIQKEFEKGESQKKEISKYFRNVRPKKQPPACSISYTKPYTTLYQKRKRKSYK